METVDTTIIALVPQIDGSMRVVYAQDGIHAERAIQLLRENPAMIDHLNGVDGIEITVAEVR